MKKKLNGLINQISGVKSVRRMNRILNQCKELVLGLPFKEGDKHMSFMK
jgi:hypothetical protein